MLAVDAPGLDTATEPDSAVTTRWILPVLIIVIGMFMTLLDVTIVNVAVPAIQRDFGGSLDDVLWIATAYTLTLGVVVPLSSWLGDRFGVRVLFAGTLFGFAAGSALCGIAWDLGSLVAFRIVQAIPGGVVPVGAMVILYKVVPRHRIGLAMGMYGLGAVFAPAIGPVLGGYLVEYLNWRLVFFINLPVGILAAAGAIFWIPKIPKVAVHRFDYPGFATIAFGLSAILLACSEGESWGWTGYRILMLLVFGSLSLALFVVIELAVEHPLLDLRLLKIKSFAFSSLFMGLAFTNLLVGAFYIPVFLQQVQGLEALDAGLLILPQALAMCVTIMMSGQLYNTLGPYGMAFTGLSVLTIGNLLMARINPSLPHVDLILWTCLRSAGVGLAIIPIMTSGLAAVPLKDNNQASAIYNVLQQIGAALGLAALNTLASSQHAQMLTDREALITTGGSLYRALSTVVGDATDLTAGTFSFVYRLALQLEYQVLSDSYGNIFMVCGFATLASITLVPFLYNERRAAAAVSAKAAVPPEPTERPTAHHSLENQRTHSAHRRSRDNVPPSPRRPVKHSAGSVSSFNAKR